MHFAGVRAELGKPKMSLGGRVKTEVTQPLGELAWFSKKKKESEREKTARQCSVEPGEAPRDPWLEVFFERTSRISFCARCASRGKPKNELGGRVKNEESEPPRQMAWKSGKKL